MFWNILGIIVLMLCIGTIANLSVRYVLTKIHAKQIRKVKDDPYEQLLITSRFRLIHYVCNVIVDILVITMTIWVIVELK